MNNFFKKLLVAPYKVGQPLTHKPKQHTPISDIFIWINTNQINTQFELLNYSLFFDECIDYDAEFVFFDNMGNTLFTHIIRNTLLRQTIDISHILENNTIIQDMGSFAVFHDYSNTYIMKENTFLAERGYISYGYQNLDFRHFVHGNLDAITSISGGYQLLGGSSIFDRTYNLQYTFDTASDYRLLFANASRSVKKIHIMCFDDIQHTQHQHTFNIVSGGVKNYQLPKLQSNYRVVIKSKLIMARPVVLRLTNNTMDVFHG